MIITSGLSTPIGANRATDPWTGTLQGADMRSDEDRSRGDCCRCLADDVLVDASGFVAPGAVDAVLAVELP